MNILPTRLPGSRFCRFFSVVLGLVTVSACTNLASTSSPYDLPTLAERAAIEDLFADYYAQFGPDTDHNFTGFFTEDGVLEVNGLVATGADEIEAMYVQAGVDDEEEVTPANAIPEGVGETFYSNLRIEIDGDTAVATMLWFSTSSELLTSPPSVTEYGRERTELVKQGGRWLISRRWILSEGGMPEGLLSSYPPPFL